ncbi:MAG: SRPBCC domain-containing protein [Candidatus Thermoplasmatota archaeon]|nr:SRPBCC domain-containing protein [Candidatus Thermoplasmatota archaeon]
MPLKRIWKAVSTSDGLSAWFMPNTLVPEVGREFIIHTGAFGDSTGIVIDIDPPHRIGFDWDKDWHVAFELKSINPDRTELRVIHSGWKEGKFTRFGTPHRVARESLNGRWEEMVAHNLRPYTEG